MSAGADSPLLMHHTNHWNADHAQDGQINPKCLHLAEQKPSFCWSADVGHDAAILHVWVPIVGVISRFPVIHNTLFTLFRVVLASIVRRRHQRELMEVVICRATVEEVEVLFIPKGMRIAIF